MWSFLKKYDLDFGFETLFKLALRLSVLGLLGFIFDFGFDQSAPVQKFMNAFYFVVLFVGVAATVLRYITKRKEMHRTVFIFDVLTVAFTVIGIFYHFTSNEPSKLGTFLYNDNWIKFAVILTFLREFSEFRITYKRTVLNPAQLFILSFFVIILLGALLLMLPKATYTGISFLDALFTSTSAVCVTGLIVVDTATYFTEFGQILILCLIQIGGLGILTFASYFSYFFKGGSSYENQLTLGEMTSSNKLGEVFSTLRHIIVITFTVEAVGAFFVFLSLRNYPFESTYQHLFFSVFHSVSAFCNGGFSTLTNGMYDETVRFNYFFQFCIIVILVMGGLGFTIVVNIVSWVKHKLFQLIPFYKDTYVHKPWLFNINSRINLITVLFLIVIGTGLFLALEYNNTLAEHGFIGKIVTSLFGATTPRTAGFNSVDVAKMALPTIMLTYLLMWIGASPGSTGGGIKTSTFALATLNILSLAQGKTRIEVYRREVADISVRRAFAIISLSLMMIGLGIMFVSVFDSDKSLLTIGFECFSAYSTVGMSLGITSSLSAPSKMVIIILMFVGRVNMLSLVIAVFKKVKYKNYRYPSEDIIIN